MSVILKSTILTSFSRHRARTSCRVLAIVKILLKVVVRESLVHIAIISHLSIAWIVRFAEKRQEIGSQALRSFVFSHFFCGPVTEEVRCGKIPQENGPALSSSRPRAGNPWKFIFEIGESYAYETIGLLITCPGDDLSGGWLPLAKAGRAAGLERD